MDLAKGRTLLSGAVYVSLSLAAGCQAGAVRTDSTPAAQPQTHSRPPTQAADIAAYQGEPTTAAARASSGSSGPIGLVSTARVAQSSMPAPTAYRATGPSAHQTGLATEGVPLRADTSSLYDPDGIGNLRFQWQVGDRRGGWTDIPRANASTYVPGQRDVGRRLRLVVSYVDGQGNLETIVTGASNPVFNVNDPPLGSAEIQGFPEEDQVLQVDTDGISDEDGLGRFEIRWEKTLDRHNWRKIDRANGDRLQLDQSDVGHYVRAVVGYTDGHGTREQLLTLPTEAVRNRDDPTRGEIRVVGEPMENRTLGVDVSSLSDEDGIGDVSVAWQISPDGKLWRDLAGETGAQVVLSQEYVGQRLRAVGHYRDNFGTDYYLASESTAPVRNLNDAPRGSVRIIGLGDYPLDDARPAMEAGEVTPVSLRASEAPPAAAAQPQQPKPEAKPAPPRERAAPRTAEPEPAIERRAPGADVDTAARPEPEVADAAPAEMEVETERAPDPTEATETEGASSRIRRPAPFLASVVGGTDKTDSGGNAPPPEVVAPVADDASPDAVDAEADQTTETPARVAMRGGESEATGKAPLADIVLLSTLAEVDEDSGPQTIAVADLVPTAFLKAGGEVTGLQLADASYGILRPKTNNTWQYTPALDFNGEAVFRIDTRVPIGGAKVYKAKMPVRSVNDPPAQIKAVLQVRAVEIDSGLQVNGDLLSLFADADDDRLRLISATLRDSADGELTFEPNGRFELRHRGAADARPVVQVKVSDGVETVSGVVRLAPMMSGVSTQ